jgi:hypothetical protein
LILTDSRDDSMTNTKGYFGLGAVASNGSTLASDIRGGKAIDTKS